MESKLRAIEAEIDSEYKKHKFMNLDRSIAFQYILNTHEIKFILNSFSTLNSSNNKELSLLAVIDSYKYALTYAINWISTNKSNKDKRVVSKFNNRNLMIANDFLMNAMSYDTVIAAFTMWSREQATVLIENNHILKFVYKPEELKYDVLDRNLLRFKESSIINELFNKSDKDILSLRRAILNLKKFSDIEKYPKDNLIMKKLNTISNGIIKEQIIMPPEWLHNNISIDEFFQFWSVLMSLTFICNFLNIKYVMGNHKIEGLPNCLMVYKINDLINIICKYSNLTFKTTEKILQYHIYNHTHKKPDIALTPFIFVTNDHLATAPALIASSMLPRNLLSHLSKNDKNEYDNNSHVFEDHMIKEFEQFAQNKKFKIRCRKKIGSLTDIDVCLIDEDKDEVMLCEFKWTIPAADSNETANKMEIQKKAISQLKTIKKYVDNNEKTISDILDIKRIRKENYFYVIVLKHCVGTDKCFEKQYPSVEYSILCRYLDENNSLQEIFRNLVERTYLPRIGIDYEEREIEDKIGNYIIKWSGYDFL